MRKAMTLAVPALFASAVAQQARAELIIPDPVWLGLPAHAASAADFVPSGWKLEVQANGDLNGDGIPDLALVLHEQADRNIMANPDGPGVNPLDSNPRLLLAALGGSSP